MSANKKKPTDELAAALFGITAILHSSGVLDRLQVSEAFVIELITWGMTAAAIGRAVYLRWTSKQAVTLTDATKALANMALTIETMRMELEVLRDAPTHAQVDPDKTPVDGLPPDNAEEIIR